MDSKLVSVLIADGADEDDVFDAFRNDPHALLVLRDPENERGIADVNAVRAALKLGLGVSGCGGG